jgi:small multidrug resistance pump
VTWLLLSIAIVTEAAASLSLRASEGLRKKIWIVPVAVFYLTAFGLLTVVLIQGMPVGIAYGIWAACGVALTAIGGRVIFKERLTPRMIVGICLIAVGVLVIELGAQAH